ncbi:membrane protein PM19L-like isoform X2 [Primulina huaijiensis]|uniref:membrane protein PM19L-like isoform X2 n=1 Tax=Primulina huaijiensis TaxID=1492673 RepID=UPI003CC70BF2
MGPLLTVNFVVYLIVVGLVGWSLDKYIDGEQNHPRKYYTFPPSLYLESPCSSNWANCADVGGNPSTLIFALLAGTTGLYSVFQGYMQARVWNNVGLASAATSTIISWGITALAFGLLCKQIIVGGHRVNACKHWKRLL